MNNNIHMQCDYDGLTGNVTWSISTSDSPNIKKNDELSYIDCKHIKDVLRHTGAWVNNQQGLAKKRETTDEKHLKAEISNILSGDYKKG